MPAITITEGLAEIKTIGKRVAKKRDFIGTHLFRQDTLRDPLAAQGGSPQAIADERQAIADLEARIVTIRSAIQQANATTMVMIGGTERSIADWLVWRREVAPGAQQFTTRLLQALANLRREASQKLVAVRQADATATATSDVVVNLDERALATDAEMFETTLGALDGILSLKNATTMIEV